METHGENYFHFVCICIYYRPAACNPICHGPNSREPPHISERISELGPSTAGAWSAVIWGLPLVGEDAVKQAAFRDGKATYNDIVWWPKGGGWKNQSPTPNVNTRYMYFFINTKQDGPVVVELPPAVPGASFYGTIEDAWYVPLVDIGFEGKGGKYLVLPPDYKGDVPDGYIVVRPETYNTMTLLRSILSVAFRGGRARWRRAGASRSKSIPCRKRPTRPRSASST